MGKRIITGILGMAVTVYVVDCGGWLFGAAVWLLALIGWFEFCRAFRRLNMRLWQSGGFGVASLLLACAGMGNAEEIVATLMLAVLLTLAKAVLDHGGFSVPEACASVCGMFYIALAFAHFLLLRFSGGQELVATAWGSLPVGAALLWVAFIGTWASDTFAFFVGSTFGRRKLCPAISPGKTIEGLIGGFAGTVLCSIGLGVFFSFSLPHMAALGFLIAAAATLGDLTESLFKRLTGVKDSGRLLPGHGGVLDRFDSLLFTVPLVYYYAQGFSLY